MNDDALKKAFAALDGPAIQEIAAHTGARTTAESALMLRYFNIELTVTLSNHAIEPDIGFLEKILVLHYLAGKRNPETGRRFLSYAELPDGMFYNAVFKRRAPKRIAHVFGQNPESLVEAASAIGGTESDFPDVSAAIPVFPHVTVIVTLARGDEDFTPEANFLFSDSLPGFFSLEDAAFLGDIVAKRLCDMNRA
jgi:hypothetical protein